MIQPETVVRDKYGFWSHSALDALEDEQPIDSLPAAEGMEFRYVEFYEDASDALLDRYEEGCSLSGKDEDWHAAIRDWQPTPPEGEGWFLLAVYETEEDGPHACFTRPKI